MGEYDIDHDEFEAWKANPVTQWVLQGLMQYAEDIREHFMLVAFYGNEHDPYALAGLRGQFIGLMNLKPTELSHERIQQWHESRHLALQLDGTWDMASQ